MLKCLIILLIIISLPYFFVPFEDKMEGKIEEGFRSGRRGRRGGRRGGGRRGGGRRAFRRYRRHHWYNDFYGYPYNFYDYLATPFKWTYNWFNFANCPSGCVANSTSPFGFSCIPDGSALSCRSNYDCSGCNVPLVASYY